MSEGQVRPFRGDAHHVCMRCSNRNGFYCYRDGQVRCLAQMNQCDKWENSMDIKRKSSEIVYYACNNCHLGYAFPGGVSVGEDHKCGFCKRGILVAVDRALWMEDLKKQHDAWIRKFVFDAIVNGIRDESAHSVIEYLEEHIELRDLVEVILT